MATTTSASKKLVEGTNLQNLAVQNAANQYVSDATKAAQANLSKYSSNPYMNFKPISTTQDAYNQWQNTLANRPEDYASNYNGKIGEMLDQIVNRKDFSYDFNADPLYQNYKNQYTQQGKQAMKDTVAQASNMTGGYGNSYATTAGSQAYQSYLQQLNDKIPELYQQAMNKYKMDTDTLMGKFNALGNQEDREFGQWNSKMGIWQNDRDYGLRAYDTLWNQDFKVNEFNANQFNNDRNFTYQNYRDSKSDDNNAYSNAYNAAHNAQNYEYQMNRDSVADDQWNKQFAYQQERDKIKDDQWAREFALKQAKANSGGGTKKIEDDPVPESAQLSKEAVDAQNYVKYIMNNTYGIRGEEAAVGNLTRQVGEGKISEEEFDAIIKNLGINEKELNSAAVRRYI